MPQADATTSTQADSHLARLCLQDLIPAISPEFRRPMHIDAWADLITRAATESVRGLCSLPIRHFKTETTLHGIIWLLLQDPTRQILFLTHSHDRAQWVGKRLRALAERTPVGPARGTNTITDWQNSAGGGVMCKSADQSSLGGNVHVLIVDDPINEVDAEDWKCRETVDTTIQFYTARCIRNGVLGPVLILMSRFHPDDPIGRRITRKAVKWEYVHQPVIINENLPSERAFAPEVMDMPALRQMRAELAEKDPSERVWHAQLMGNPQPVGADMFGEPSFYDAMPAFGGHRQCYGVDLAFTDEEHSDWFGRTAGRLYGQTMYIQDVKRHKIEPTTIESTCKIDLETYGNGAFYSYMSGPEIGTAKLLRERGVPIVTMHARYSKFVRAQRTIKRWNDGKILLPRPEVAPWVNGFVARVKAFRGLDKGHDDDEIDALVSMCDGYMGGAGARVPVSTVGKAYGGFGSK